MRSHLFNFIVIALSIYAVINLYIVWRTWVMLAPCRVCRGFALLPLLALIVSYPLSRYLGNHGQEISGSICMWIGSFWIAAMVYLFLFFLALNIFDAVIWLLSRPGDWTDTWFRIRPLIWILSVVGTALLLVYGHWNALHPRVVTVDWMLPKLPAQSTPIKIVAVSDIHMGTIIGRERVQKIVDLINAQKPDLVLLVGDTIDSDVEPVVKHDIGAPLQTLHSTYGTFGVTGNHEYIGDVHASTEYLDSRGVHLLRDQAALIGDRFILVGREDLSMARLNGGPRAALSSILSPVDRTKPIILMDHQPIALDEAEQDGADGQISGHTHNGQFWPFNYVVRSIFKLAYGSKKFGTLNAYVSCGVGTWGPPVRIGNHPEIVAITLRPVQP